MPRKKEVVETVEENKTEVMESAAESATENAVAEDAAAESEEEAAAEEAVTLSEEEINPEVLEGDMEDDINTEAEEEEEASPAEPVRSRAASRPNRRTLMVDRGSENAANDATRWHFYETAAFQRDYMRRPVFFGKLIAARRIRAAERSIWIGDVLHENKQSGITQVVSIPYTELLVNTENMSNMEAESRINAMTGATVEFIITGVIRETDMILGSRVKAMEILQRRYYINTDRNMRPQVHLGRLVQARIMMVTPYSLTLDVFGVETRLNRQDVKWEWTSALTDDFSVGDLITVKVEDVTISEDRKIKISVTGKIGDNPDMKNLKYATVGSTQLGEVTSFANGIYFIRLYVGVNAVSHIVTGDKGCGVGDRVKLRVTAYNRAQGTVTGKIISVF